MVTETKTSVRDLAPFWSGIVGDLKLQFLGEKFDRCSDNNGFCINCPFALQCRQLWDDAVILSVTHPLSGLSVHDHRVIYGKFYKLSQSLS